MNAKYYTGTALLITAQFVDPNTGDPIDLTGASVTVKFLRPDNQKKQYDTTSGVTVTDAATGSVSFLFNPTDLSLAGNWKGQFAQTGASIGNCPADEFTFVIYQSL